MKIWIRFSTAAFLGKGLWIEIPAERDFSRCRKALFRSPIVPVPTRPCLNSFCEILRSPIVPVSMRPVRTLRSPIVPVSIRPCLNSSCENLASSDRPCPNSSCENLAFPDHPARTLRFPIVPVSIRPAKILRSPIVLREPCVPRSSLSHWSCEI